jgi:hypothetical protein
MGSCRAQYGFIKALKVHSIRMRTISASTVWNGSWISSSKEDARKSTLVLLLARVLGRWRSEVRRSDELCRSNELGMRRMVLLPVPNDDWSFATLTFPLASIRRFRSNGESDFFPAASVISTC